MKHHTIPGPPAIIASSRPWQIFVLGCSLLALTPATRAQLLSWDFSEGTGTNTANDGTAGTANLGMYSAGSLTNLYSASGLGVSGSAGDYAFDLSSATGMGANTPAFAGPAGSASGTNVTSALSSLTSFTLTGWLNPSSTLTGAARIFVASNFALQAGSANQLQLTVGATSLTSSSSYTSVGSWMFFAVTYDGTATTNNVTFYTGTTSSGLTILNTGTLNSSTLASFTGALVVGNNNTNGSRPFDGLMDNLAIYGTTSGASGALTQDQITSIYSAAIPEPSTYAALAGMTMLGFAALCRRRITLR